MRAEDKELEGPELEREVNLEEQTEVREVEEEEEELPILANEQSRDIDLAHRSRLFDALALILSEEQVNISLLYLPQREAMALDFLQTAVTGRNSMNEFVFAEDRQGMLEQALAVLQANLTHGDQAELTELHAKFDLLSERVGTLRASLLDLEDAQDDLIEQRVREAELEEDGTADADEPAPSEETKDPEAITDFIAAALHAMAAVKEPEKQDRKKRANTVPPVAGESTLVGPEVPDKESAPTTLVGPEIPDKETPPTTLVGPEVPDVTSPPTTLVGPEVPDKPSAPTTLVGPEVPDKQSAPSTLDGPEPLDTAFAPRTPVVSHTTTPVVSRATTPPAVSRTTTPPAVSRTTTKDKVKKDKDKKKKDKRG